MKKRRCADCRSRDLLRSIIMVFAVITGLMISVQLYMSGLYVAAVIVPLCYFAMVRA